MAKILTHRQRRPEDETRAQGEHDPILSIRIPKWKKEALVKMAKEDGKTTSRTVNEIIDDALEAWGKYTGAPR